VAINLQKQGELQRARQEAAGEGLPGAAQQTNVEVKRHQFFSAQLSL